MNKKTGKQAWSAPRLEQIAMVDTAGATKTMMAAENEQGAAMQRS